MAGEIRDISLAESGMRKIEWVKRNCPLLTMLMEEFEKTKPFAGKKIALSVHLEAKTAYLCLTLASGGAQMYVTGSNPLSTQDDVAAALASCGSYDAYRAAGPDPRRDRRVRGNNDRNYPPGSDEPGGKAEVPHGPREQRDDEAFL